MPDELTHLDPADKGYMLAENTMLKQRVHEMLDDAVHRARAYAAGVDASKLVDERIAELERVRTELENDVAYLDTQNKRLRWYYRRERRAVGKLAKHAAWHDATSAGCPPGREHGGPATEKRACTVAPTCTACWAAWAREQARAEGGE